MPGTSWYPPPACRVKHGTYGLVGVESEGGRYEQGGWGRLLGGEGAEPLPNHEVSRARLNNEPLWEPDSSTVKA